MFLHRSLINFDLKTKTKKGDKPFLPLAKLEAGLRETG